MAKLEEILESQRKIVEMICRIADGELYFDFENDKVLNSAKLPNNYYLEKEKQHLRYCEEQPILTTICALYYYITHPMQCWKVLTYLSKLRKEFR